MFMRIRQSVSCQRGKTLIEILASIVILSIIVIPLLGFFVQSQKTVQVSGEIIDATYVAQLFMEETIQHSKGNNLFLSGPITIKGYGSQFDSANKQHTLEFTEENRYFVTINLKHKNSNLVQVLVKVFEDNVDLKLEAQMESIVVWEGLENETNP
ncbi:type IV pilus modification PilV family protein [Evansella tamaricis]|uniref:Prepilin-type N-terminal cleavage/methylation domain-containing protein n=1 Tax=Evansella tamaricis TaxID=2069301 RepID=A0ABS6JBS2_9BACI|nr:prepilin-type N-terminal cleavage/methylation domain-containing protein [Evansella tamaricis]MBU9711011.1 prepilin-type N-terminal cleavage/methylation domain-containing protein [Evansella tamaricis]